MPHIEGFERLAQERPRVDFGVPLGEISPLAESLRGRRFHVTLIQVDHGGKPSEQVFQKFDRADLRTLEWRGEGIQLQLPRELQGISWEDAAVVGLGPSPLYPLASIKKENTGGVARPLDDYFTAVVRRYLDTRFVDLHRGADELMYELVYGSTGAEPLGVGGYNYRDARDIAKYCLDVLRDFVQAYHIARILSLATYDGREISLAHIGGAGHTALPIILQEVYGIQAEILEEEPVPPVFQVLSEIIPPYKALQVLTSTQGAIQWNTAKAQEYLGGHADEFHRARAMTNPSLFS